jgi:hypothetical protein
MGRMGARRSTRRTVLLALATFLIRQSAQADELSVPIELQVNLLDRVVRFERNYAARGDAPALVVVVTKGDETASLRAAALASAAITKIRSLGARPASVATHRFSSPAALRSASHNVDLVYLMPGFNRADLQAIAASFVDSSVLTVSVSSADAENGVALAFELEGSKPRIVVNLRQARTQRLDFNAQLLRLARVLQ